MLLHRTLAALVLPATLLLPTGVGAAAPTTTAATLPPTCTDTSWVAGSIDLCDVRLVYCDDVDDDEGADIGYTPAAPRRPSARWRAPAGDVRYPAGAVNTADLVRLEAGTLTTDQGGAVVAASAAGDGPAFVSIRPQAVALHRGRPEGSARNAWPVTVSDVDHHHDRAHVRLTGAVALVAEVTPAAVAELGLRAGERVWASVKATDIEVYAR